MIPGLPSQFPSLLIKPHLHSRQSVASPFLTFQLLFGGTEILESIDTVLSRISSVPLPPSLMETHLVVVHKVKPWDRMQENL